MVFRNFSPCGNFAIARLHGDLLAYRWRIAMVWDKMRYGLLARKVKIGVVQRFPGRCSPADAPPILCSFVS